MHFVDARSARRRAGVRPRGGHPRLIAPGEGHAFGDDGGGGGRRFGLARATDRPSAAARPSGPTIAYL